MNFYSHGFKGPRNFTSSVIIVQYQKYSRHLMHTCLLESYIQYLVIPYNGKESEKEYICVYMYMYVCMYV